MSKLIEKFREAYKGVSPTKLVDTYFDLLSKIEECKRENDFRKMLVYCQMSISLIEPLIEQTKKEFGSFDIKSIPAIDLGCTYWAIYGAEGQLLNLKEVVEYFPELDPWKENIEEAFAMKDLVLRIYRYVRDNEGCLQKDLKRVLGIEDGSLVSYVVNKMALIGKLKKKKMGNTYSLFVK